MTGCHARLQSDPHLVTVQNQASDWPSAPMTFICGSWLQMDVLAFVNTKQAAQQLTLSGGPGYITSFRGLNTLSCYCLETLMDIYGTETMSYTRQMCADPAVTTMLLSHFYFISLTFSWSPHSWEHRNEYIPIFFFKSVLLVLSTVNKAIHGFNSSHLDLCKKLTSWFASLPHLTFNFLPDYYTDRRWLWQERNLSPTLRWCEMGT